MNTIFYHGKIYVAEDTFAEALWVQGNTIAMVGRDGEVLDAAPADALRVDLGGKLLLPGFNDSHQHLTMVAEWAGLCDLSTADSIAEMQRRCIAFLEAHPGLQGLHGIGWNQDYFTSGEKRPPNRAELDAISTEIPVVLERVCGHVCSGNTAALDAAGFLAPGAAVDGGEILRDADGQPNGVVSENACYVLTKVIPRPKEAQLEALYQQCMEVALSEGITSVQSNDVSDNNYTWMLPLWRRLHAAGKLKLRYRHQFCFLELEHFQDFLQGEWQQRDAYGEMLSLGPLKLFKDGSLGARTATLRQDYADEPGNRGTEALSDEKMDALCALAAEHGIQVVTHAIGDDAIARTIQSYEKTFAPAAAGAGKNPLRHSVVHCQITDLPLLQQMAEANIGAMVQPIFLHYDSHIAAERVGEGLASTSYAFATMKKLGIPLSLGTDAPVEPFHPLRNLYCAVTRKDLNGCPAGGWHPGECLSMAQAVDAYTAGSAWAEFAEHRKGRLQPGFLADMTLLDTDIFTEAPEALLKAQVLMTVVDGSIVYQKKERSERREEHNL